MGPTHWIGLRPLPPACVMLLVLAGCSSDRPPAETPPPPSPGAPAGEPQPVTGNERLSWRQAGPNAATVAGYKYAVFVDAVRTPLQATCSSQLDADGYSCLAPMPALGAGRHVLELVTSFEFTEGFVDSARSAPLIVNKGAASSPEMTSVTGEPTDSGRSQLLSVGGVQDVDVVATNLNAPVALAQSPDRRLFVGERSGRILILDEPLGSTHVALRQGDLDDDIVLHDLVLHPLFERNRFVYALHTVAGAEDPVWRLTRLREVDGSLAEPAVLLDGISSSRTTPGGALGFGPDGKLYVAVGGVDIGVDGAQADGQVLRLNDDGTAPRDAGTSTPVMARTDGQPIGLGWHLPDGSLWIVARSGANGAPSETGRNVRVLVRTDAADAGIYRSAGFPPSRDSLLIVTREDGHLERWGRTSTGSWVLQEALVRGSFGRLGSVTQGRDGSIYLGSGNTAPGAAVGRDVIVKIAPVRH
jgi:glucose/arabinose dehydrogenase